MSMLGKAAAWVVSRGAKAFGFQDPVKLFAQLQLFAQPSEVAFPIELLRFGFSVHARGMVNYCAIQHNLDWLWPYWAQRQFSPLDIAFVPRAFSLTHINLTHRNWTALGVPGYAHYPIVDPRGLMTPFYDSWSIDAWVITEKDAGGNGEDLIPATQDQVEQKLLFRPFLKVSTASSQKKLKLTSTAWVERENEHAAPFLHARFEANSESKSWLAVALRPYNPEGVSVLNHIEFLPDKKGWRVNKEKNVYFAQAYDRHAFSQYQEGDVYYKLPAQDSSQSMTCAVGLASAVVLFEIKPGQTREVEIHIPLEKEDAKKQTVLPEASTATAEAWRKNIQHAPLPAFPDDRLRFIYEASLHTAVLHSPLEIFPGPFTYKHFWFRDAALISHALLCAGLPERVERVIDAFLSRQKKSGYFHSQEGEWDSNGQVLWIMHKFCQMTGRAPKPEWKKPILQGARWITRKRITGKPELAHNGLFPAGFSAEYLGPNDFYYWDDFWGVQGLNSAAWLMEKYGESGESGAVQEFQKEADDFLASIETSLKKNSLCKNSSAMPASPYRRLDSGSIGSLTAGYPLRLWPEQDLRLVETIHYLADHCFVKGAFFQDIAHAGINPYLTLHMAQNMLRAGDPRYWEAIRKIAGLATSTGQWPEAIHPQTLGGCMGDGQHAWASAEWMMMIRNMFVREEGGTLILCSGIPEVWLESNQTLQWGPTPTEFGAVQVRLQCTEETITLEWKGAWHQTAPKIEIRLPGFERAVPQNTADRITFSRGLRRKAPAERL